MPIDAESRENLEKRIASQARASMRGPKGNTKADIQRGNAARKEATKRLKFDKSMLKRLSTAQSTDNSQ